MKYQTIGAAIANAPQGGSSEPEYLTFTNVHETETAHISMNTDPLEIGTPHEPVIFWSKTKDNFVQWNYSAIELLPGESVYMYGDNPDGVNHFDPETEEVDVASFVITDGSVAASGNIQTLRDIKAKKKSPLPETPGCCALIFGDCVSLTTAPELPATTLANSCYVQMFVGCASLTTAPELPATTLAYACYMGMFYNCESLTTAPELPATTLAPACYTEMFHTCHLTTAPELPATTLAEGCYAEMFATCHLTTAPELPATTLAEGCYDGMFKECGRLTTAPELPATTLAYACYHEMFYRCVSLTTAPELPATTLADNCYEGMFRYCRSLTTSPELPATTLADACYVEMFEGNESLASVHVAFTEWPEGGIANWLANVAESGTFTKPAALPEQRGTDYIPNGWTIVNE